MYVTRGPKVWLRLDGLVLLVASIFLFANQHQKWWIYPALLLAPDIFMLGYLKNTKIGALLYNIGHSYVTPSFVIFSGWYLHHSIAIAVGIIWLGHIGMDRFFGYGLKYGSDFKHTHLGDLSKSKE